MGQLDSKLFELEFSDSELVQLRRHSLVTLLSIRKISAQILSRLESCFYILRFKSPPE
ncbi:hypothetical protein SBF1_3410011 [Candidatus Desulfosporosinus infrequens]|uniref:Uncharacterized protein n=1 Tax=Candidatus Desulfosporosinus infrequens TaxID=2043169 RepID=A0A2U3L1Y2_9FIRM|nr:hypothetical protein SBF1_3410011 [Candidatus Desulfosporosinus infrequens]